MKRFILAAATILTPMPLLAGNLVPAQPDPVPYTPAPAPVAAPMGGDWTGGFVGAQLGYGWADADTAGGNSTGEDALYGVHAGYDYDFGQFVLGGEVQYDATDISLNGTGESVDGIARLKLRGGYDLGRTLVYATAGGARAYTSAGEDNGYTLGLGMDYKVTDQFTVGGEYQYSKFKDFDGTGVDADGNAVSLRGTFRF